MIRLPNEHCWGFLLFVLFSGANLLLVLGRLIMLISPFESMYTYFLLNMGLFQCHVGELRGKTSMDSNHFAMICISLSQWALKKKFELYFPY